jgi:hypothetical protein
MRFVFVLHEVSGLMHVLPHSCILTIFPFSHCSSSLRTPPHRSIRLDFTRRGSKSYTPATGENKAELLGATSNKMSARSQQAQARTKCQDYHRCRCCKLQGGRRRSHVIKKEQTHTPTHTHTQKRAWAWSAAAGSLPAASAGTSAERRAPGAARR